jgi:hypothetical protein
MVITDPEGVEQMPLRPNKAFIVFDTILLQQREELLFERKLPMMFLLIGNVPL